MASEESKVKTDDTPAVNKDGEAVTANEVTPEGVVKEEKETGEKRKKGQLEESPIMREGNKRVRKSADTFRPEQYNVAGPQVRIYKGQGSLLRDIISTRESVESYKASELQAAHKFLYGGRGKVSNKIIKENILNFSGYLRPTSDDDDEVEAFNDEMEKKMSVKAFKLKVAEIKMLCDVFDIDRSGDGKPMTKDDLIDRLLDFLAEPTQKATKTHQKKSKKKARKQEEEEEVLEKGQMPSDKALRKWVRAYVACFDLDKATTKHAIETASDKFGVDLSEKKALIKEMLTQEI